MHRFLDLGSSKQLSDKWQQFILKDKLITRDIIQHYWEHIFQSMQLSEGKHDSLSIATPYCYDCCTRSVIMEILTSQYGMAQCDILPRPLALLLGYLAQHPQDDPRGDLLCIFEEENSLDFSFISLNGSLITLEYQNSGIWEDLQTAAERLAWYSTRGWEFDHLLYINSSITDKKNPTGFPTGQAINLLRVEDASSTIVEGLRYSTLNSTLAGPRILQIVYPYDFYLQKFDPLKNRMVLEKIPFDTANLELNLHGTYKIASLSNLDFYTHPEDKQLELAVYELDRVDQLPESFNWPPAMIFRGFKEDLPHSLELWLNMTVAEISLTDNSLRNAWTTAQSAEFLFRLHNSQRDLYKLLENSANHNLQKDLLNSISPPYYSQQENLEKRLEITRLKLYGLLQLWSFF